MTKKRHFMQVDKIDISFVLYLKRLLLLVP